MNKLFANILLQPKTDDEGGGTDVLDTGAETSVSVDGGRRGVPGKPAGRERPARKERLNDEGDEGDSEEIDDQPPAKNAKGAQGAKGKPDKADDERGVSVDGEGRPPKPAAKTAANQNAKGAVKPAKPAPKAPAESDDEGEEADDQVDGEETDELENEYKIALQYVPNLTEKQIGELSKTAKGRDLLRAKADAFFDTLKPDNGQQPPKGRQDDQGGEQDDENADGGDDADPIMSLLGKKQDKAKPDRGELLAPGVDAEGLKELRGFLGDGIFDKTIAPMALSLRQQGQVIARQNKAIAKLSEMFESAVDRLEFNRTIDSWNDKAFGRSDDLNDEHMTARQQLHGLAMALIAQGIKGPGGRRISGYQALKLAKASMARTSAVDEARAGLAEQLQKRSAGTGIMPRRQIARQDGREQGGTKRSRSAAVAAAEQKMRDLGIL